MRSAPIDDQTHDQTLGQTCSSLGGLAEGEKLGPQEIVRVAVVQEEVLFVLRYTIATDALHASQQASHFGLTHTYTPKLSYHNESAKVTTQSMQ